MVTYLAKELWDDLNFPFEKVSSPFQLDWTGALPRDLFVDPSVFLCLVGAFAFLESDNKSTNSSADSIHFSN